MAQAFNIPYYIVDNECNEKAVSLPVTLLKGVR